MKAEDVIERRKSAAGRPFFEKTQQVNRSRVRKPAIWEKIHLREGDEEEGVNDEKV